MKHQIIRQRIVDGVKRNSGYFIEDSEIPDHEWHQHAMSEDFHPPLPRRKPKPEPEVIPVVNKPTRKPKPAIVEVEKPEPTETLVTENS